MSAVWLLLHFNTNNSVYAFSEQITKIITIGIGYIYSRIVYIFFYCSIVKRH